MPLIISFCITITEDWRFGHVLEQDSWNLQYVIFYLWFGRLGLDLLFVMLHSTPPMHFGRLICYHRHPMSWTVSNSLHDPLKSLFWGGLYFTLITYLHECGGKEAKLDFLET